MSNTRPPQSETIYKEGVDKIKPFPIVGIGSSAGGLEAMTVFLTHMPNDTGFAFVLVQHLDPKHESALTQLLSRVTTLPVSEITNDLAAEPNHVYVIPPNTSLRINQGILTLQPREKIRRPHHPIDSFLESLAEDRQERAIGVILSGTATDGTRGLEAIKAEGGITFAQDSSARYDSMPKSAIASGSVDFVMSPENIALELARIAKHPYLLKLSTSLTASEGEQSSATLLEGDENTPSQTPSKEARRSQKAESHRERPQDQHLRKILGLLRNHSGVDFSLYKMTTIQRRIARRMVVNKLNTLEAYATSLVGKAQELDALYSDMLIGVTGFFRNPEAFEVLKKKVFPKLLQQRGEEPIRVWVLGCSTGQEAYSIAMVFAEAAEQASHLHKLQVFATDLNDSMLEKARHGLYPGSLMQDVSPERLRRFFIEEDGGYRISKELRESIVFARQNLISDPPFLRMDLISCRNLMIYLEAGLQRKVIPTFHYALKPEGFLFLGASESISSFTDLFEPVDKTHRIFVRKSSPARALHLPVKTVSAEQLSGAAPLKGRHTGSREARGTATENLRGALGAEREADRIVVKRFAPPAVLISADFQVLQFRGSTGAYLQPPTGKASFDVLKMAREGLMLPLRTAINKAKKENKVVRKEHVSLRQSGDTRRVNIEVIPLKHLTERCFLVVFEEDAEAPNRDASTSPVPTESSNAEIARAREEDTRRNADLEAELIETREYLQSVEERQEAANEELQASNEEVQSANEELQSINEELETSKEELESTNEELTTINEEMASRNAELGRLNSDLVNIQTSTRLPIVFLGRDLTIRRFSAQAQKQFNLTATDLGRPFTHVRHNLVLDGGNESFADLENLLGDVIASVREQEREVRDTNGRWYSLRARPYLTPDNKVDGAVLVLVDINDLKQTEMAVAEARDYAEAIIRTAHDPLVILNADLRIHAVNEAFYSTFQVQPADSIGRLIYDLGNGQWQIPKLRELLEEILPRKTFFNNFKVTHHSEGIGSRSMLLNARQLDVNGQPARMLLGIQDVTETIGFQTAAREDAEKFKVLFDRSPLPKWTLDPAALRFINVNDAAVEHYGYSHDQFLQMTLLDVLADETDITQAKHHLREIEVTRHRKANGEVIDVETRTNEITTARNRIWLTSIHDITELKRAEQALKAVNAQLANELSATRQLQQISTQLIQEDMPDALYQQSLNAAVTIMHADMASIQMVDEEQNALRMLASRGFDPDSFQVFEWVRPTTKTSCSVARRQGCRVIMPDVETSELLIDTEDLEKHRAAGIRAVQSTPLISRDGRIIGVISTHWRRPHQPAESELRLMDILARQAADLIERRKADEALRDADRRKTEFLGVLAHELRTPLSPIRNALEIMRLNRASPEEVLSANTMMERQLNQMVRLVDDLLDVSRISRGKVELRLGRVELASVLNHAVESGRPLLESKKLQLTVALPEKPIYLNADPMRLAQAVINLLNNASKFTEKGGRIWLTAEVDVEKAQAVIRVRDTGIGIDASQIHRIFEMFTQVETSLERRQSGLGIGLALTKALVELHGGELEAQSAGQGHGSEFVVRLPILTDAPAPPPKPVVSDSTVTTPHRVLIVDDNIDSADSLSMLLEMTGNETYRAHDGLEAVEAAETFRPDVVLLDIGLPKLNGYDAARRIREQPWGKKMVLVALTGWGQDTDRQRSREAGFDVHLVKPVDHDALTKLLGRLPDQ